MVTKRINKDSSKWPELYSAERSYWQDAKRIFSFIMVLTIGLAWATLYVALYAFIYPERVLGLGLEGRFQVILTFAKGIFSLLLPIVFIILGFALLLRNTSVFFKAFYQPPEDLKVSKTILARMLGIPPLPPMLKQFFHYRFVLINITDVAKGKFALEEHPVHWLGGPFVLLILDGAGVYLQRGNQFSRTLGPGIYFLERFETIQEIVDLRRQTIRSGTPSGPPPIQGRTKDGIKIKFNLEISFHILRPELKEQGGAGPSRALAEKTEAEREAEELFLIGTPVNAGDLDAIRKAVERTTLRRRPASDDTVQYSEARWQDGVWGAVSGELAKYITKHYLDELLIFESSVMKKSLAHFVGASTRSEEREKEEPTSTGQLLSGQERERIRRDLDSILRNSSGVTLTDLRIVDFELPSVVNDQRIQYLNADLESRIKQMKGNSAAEQIRIREKARTRAQQELIESVADSLARVDAENYTEAVLLSLSNILSQGLEDPTLSTFMTRETFDAIEQLREFLGGKEEPHGDNLSNR